MARNRLQTEYLTLPGTGPGLQAAIVADLHNKNHDAVFEAVSAARPDLVLIPGDLMEGQSGPGNRYPERAGYPNAPGLVLLKKLADRWPVFYSPGNHENRIDDAHRSAIEATGATLLTDSFAALGHITVGGLKSDFDHGGHRYTPPPNTDFLKRFAEVPGYKILLAHHPEWYDPYISRYSFNAVISGHAHGGQWRLGRLAAYAPGQGIFPKYTKGIYHGNLVVSPGLANHCPVPRIFNPPLLMVVTLGNRKV